MILEKATVILWHMGLLKFKSNVVLVTSQGSAAVILWRKACSTQTKGLQSIQVLSVKHGRFDGASKHGNSDPRSKGRQQ